jgi:hypothetical protein
MAQGVTRNIYGTVIGGPYGPGADVLKAGVYASSDYTSWGFNDSNGTAQLTVTTAGVDFAAITVASITGDSATFPIKGLDATAGNTAGGTLSLTGGAGFGTGAGAAVTQTGGASGAGATGNGGASAIVGGAALSTNGTGGAASSTGGAGRGTGAGGAASLVGGAGGATGPGGTVAITAGATGAGAGAGVTITAADGAGGTNGGGNINLVPGAAVSTGTPGEVLVAGTAGLFSVGWQQYLAASVPVSGTSYPFFVATRAFRVKAVSVYASSATTPTVDIIKDTGTTAPGAGTSVLTGTISFSGVANTVVNGTVSSTIATVTLAAGDRLSAKWGGTVGSLTGAVIQVLLTPV